MIVCDTGPLQYLVLIGAEEIHPALYDEVLLPRCVELELRRAKTPARVLTWLDSRPAWLVSSTDDGLEFQSLKRDSGGQHAIVLAKTLLLDIIMDDKDGRVLARQSNVGTIGTLGVLQKAADKKLLDLEQSVQRLRSFGFYLTTKAENQILAEWRSNQGSEG